MSAQHTQRHAKKGEHAGSPLQQRQKTPAPKGQTGVSAQQNNSNAITRANTPVRPYKKRQKTPTTVGADTSVCPANNSNAKKSEHTGSPLQQRQKNTSNRRGRPMCLPNKQQRKQKGRTHRFAPTTTTKNASTVGADRCVCPTKHQAM